PDPTITTGPHRFATRQPPFTARFQTVVLRAAPEATTQMPCMAITLANDQCKSHRGIFDPGGGFHPHRS
ncbi:MAG TPA: hypothetical protein VL882_21865, partial [Vicinamibacterales bacterium]|nr:hypothetical protein [Vicinamibacterales bacterium]